VTAHSIFRRPLQGVHHLMSTLGTAAAVLNDVNASRRAPFRMRPRDPTVVGIHARLAIVTFSATVLRGTMTWAARQHLQLSAVRPA